MRTRARPEMGMLIHLELLDLPNTSPCSLEADKTVRHPNKQKSWARQASPWPGQVEQKRACSLPLTTPLHRASQAKVQTGMCRDGVTSALCMAYLQPCWLRAQVAELDHPCWIPAPESPALGDLRQVQYVSAPRILYMKQEPQKFLLKVDGVKRQGVMCKRLENSW